ARRRPFSAAPEDLSSRCPSFRLLRGSRRPRCLLRHAWALTKRCLQGGPGCAARCHARRFRGCGEHAC
ncbi:dhaT, partial [Symbiodinium sp. CCMP2456]